MIADLKPYPTMKDSGVPWLGKVPEHWEVLPNRAIFDEVKERDYPEEQMLSVTITKGVIRQQALLADSSKKDSSNQDRSAYKFVRPGDIAYNKMRAWQGAVGASEYQGIVSPAYVVQRPRGIADSHYFHHLLRTPAFAKEAERWSYGITSDMWSLRPEHFKVIYSCVPPLTEQSAIVRFLDHADRRIRRYIHAKQKLIKLLDEQKQAIIHRAITRGLDPNVRLKPSGVEWLGDVPEHWTIGRIKTEMHNLNTRRVPLSGPDRGRMTSRQYDYYGASGVIDKVDEYLFDDELLLIAEDGANLVLRNLPLAIIAKGKFWVNNHAHILKPRRGSLDYFAALLEGIDYVQWITGAAQPKLTQDRLMAIPIPVPPEAEQMVIVAWIQHNTSHLQATIVRARKEINLLREYRTRLIADVVTGKLDVREAAAKLPDEMGESELLDEAETPMEGDEETEISTPDDISEEAEA
ncbi:MAG: restriction endonuclease subunit S [Nitrospira sp.]|nr:restriction endonuclease subunit S [Nitrospira sp.]